MAKRKVRVTINKDGQWVEEEIEIEENETEKDLDKDNIVGDMKSKNSKNDMVELTRTIRKKGKNIVLMGEIRAATYLLKRNEHPTTTVFTLVGRKTSPQHISITNLQYELAKVIRDASIARGFRINTDARFKEQVLEASTVNSVLNDIRVKSMMNRAIGAPNRRPSAA